jgi:hypothetical protein
VYISGSGLAEIPQALADHWPLPDLLIAQQRDLHALCDPKTAEN